MKNIFNDPSFREELERDASQARERLVSRPRLVGLSAGDTFFFPESNELPIRWVCILPHVDNGSLWYLVAADEYQETGTCDIELAESHPWYPLTLRCNVGFWAHQEDLSEQNYLGRLAGDVIEDAKDRLKEMVTGEVVETEHGVIAENSEDYVDWMSELTTVVDQIEARLHSSKVTLAKVTFDSSWCDDPLIAGKYSDTIALAADTAGWSSVPESTGAILPSKLPGRLLVQQDGTNFDLVYYPESSEEPPKLLLINGELTRSGMWHRGPDGVFTWSDSISAKQNQLELTIGSETFVLPIS